MLRVLVVLAVLFPISVMADPVTDKDILAFDVAIRAVCPQISGVRSDGSIIFLPEATCQDAANAAAKSFIASHRAQIEHK